jgi:hypothetical protein
MKDFNINKEQKTEEIEVREARKEIQLVNSKRYIKGLNMFELNLETRGIRQMLPIKQDAELVQQTNMITGRKSKKSTSIIRYGYRFKEKCIYAQATNLKNAQKKFEKWIIEQGKKIVK